MELILFLGSGVSLASGLPLVKDLTEWILGTSPRSANIDAHQLRGLARDADARVRPLLRIMADLETLDAKRTKALFRGATSYEDLFYLCEEMANWRIGLADNSTLTSFMESLAHRASGLLTGGDVSERLDDLGLLAREARMFIQAATAAVLAAAAPAGLDLILELARSKRIEQLNIVTLNHDTLVEQLLAAHEIAVADGFGPLDGDVRWYDDAVYDSSRASVRLFKIHGSVDWYRFNFDGLPRTAVVQRHNAAVSDGHGRVLKRSFREPSFLTGGNKAIRYQHGIYIDLQFRLQELFRRCDVILMCGYGWGDAAINLRLETWMDNRRNRIVLMHPNPDEIIDRSMIIASAYNWWVSSGRLITVRHWMCDLTLAEIERPLFALPA